MAPDEHSAAEPQPKVAGCGAGWLPAGRLSIGPTGRQPGCLAFFAEWAVPVWRASRVGEGARLVTEKLPGVSSVVLLSFAEWTASVWLENRVGEGVGQFRSSYRASPGWADRQSARR